MSHFDHFDANDFRTPAAYSLARRLVESFDRDRDGEWSEYVLWSCGYDVPREIRAGEVSGPAAPESDVDADAATLVNLA